MLPEALDKLWKAQVYAVSFPSHTSSELQLLDITCFRPLKGLFRQAVHAARLDNGFLSINKWSLPEIICGAMKKALTSVNISAGFAKAGIFPFNKDWVSEHKHVFKISESIMKSQPDSEDSLRSLQLKKSESIVQSSAG